VAGAGSARRGRELLFLPFFGTQHLILRTGGMAMRLVFLMYLALGLVCSFWFLGVMLMMQDHRWLPSGDDSNRS
jgi:hypothetical protein